MADAWNDDDVFTLIAMYEDCPSLWDPTSTEYKNKIQKQKWEEEIATALDKPGTYDPESRFLL